MDDIVKDFLVESYENRDQLDHDLVALEQDPTSHALLSSIFRTIHTIKGTCGFLSFSKLESVVHVSENSLSSLHDDHLRPNAEITSALQAMGDAIRQMLASIQVLQFTMSQKDTAFVAPSQRLNLITSELQEGVMKTRMQPIGNVWRKFPRVVRDLALTCHKQVRVERDGKELELDKTIIEAIKDPLIHMVRNSVDHGVEPPEQRLAAGKPVEGALLLKASHESGAGGGIEYSCSFTLRNAISSCQRRLASRSSWHRPPVVPPGFRVSRGSRGMTSSPFANSLR